MHDTRNSQSVPAVTDAVPDLTALLRNPDILSPDVVSSIVGQAGGDALTLRQALTSLGTVLLLAPELARHVPLSFLDGCRQLVDDPVTWQSLILIMLHTSKGEETCQWWQSVLTEHAADDATWRLLEHICDWFPERLDGELLQSLAIVHPEFQCT